VAGSTVSRSTDVPTGFQYSIKNQRDNGNTLTGALDGYYSIETANSLPLAGQTVTLSFYGKKGANYSGGNFSLELRNGTGTDQAYYAYTGSNQIAISTSIALTTSWARYSITGTVPANATEIAFKTSWSPTGTAGADDAVYLTGFQLEVGSKMTPFQTASGGSIQGELAMCQRYYWRGVCQFSYSNFGTGFGTSATTAQFQTALPVTMRLGSPVLDYSTLAAYDGTTVTAFTTVILTGSQTSGDILAVTGTAASGLTNFRPYVLLANNNAAAYIGVSQEL
jgi:hypothetical protein